jgi:HEAT repeat protein
MRCRFSRLLLACTLLALAGCSTRETKQALAQASDLASQQKYEQANAVLVDALRAREAKIRANSDDPGADADKIAALTKKVQADSEILKMERAQLPLYLHLDEASQAAAVDTDINTGHPGDTSLADLLQDKDSKIRTGVVRTLGLVGGAASIDPLIAATKDNDEDVRSEAVSSLGQIRDPRAVPPLIHALNDTYWFVRSQAADALEREKDPNSIDPLLDTVSDPDSNVEGAAENALANLAQMPGVSPNVFAAHLNDTNAKIAMISTVCLAIMKDKRATPILIEKAASPDVWTRLHAVQGLGETGDPAVIPTLRTTLKDPEVNVRGWSIIGLDNLKDTGSIDALRALAKDPTQTSHIQEFAQAAANHLASLNSAAASSTPK